MVDGLSPAQRCYAVGRMLQLQPTEELVEAFLETAPQVAQIISRDTGGLDFDAIAQDYLRLFVGLGTPLAPPWESAWASDARLLFQRETLDVRYWYRSTGLQAAALHHEPDDHIGLELEFIGSQLERGENAIAAAFAREHPLKWARRWAQAVRDNASHPFYPALADEAMSLLEQSGASAE